MQTICKGMYDLSVFLRRKHLSAVRTGHARCVRHSREGAWFVDPMNLVRCLDPDINIIIIISNIKMTSYKMEGGS